MAYLLSTQRENIGGRCDRSRVVVGPRLRPRRLGGTYTVVGIDGLVCRAPCRLSSPLASCLLAARPTNVLNCYFSAAVGTNQGIHRPCGPASHAGCVHIEHLCVPRVCTAVITKSHNCLLFPRLTPLILCPSLFGAAGESLPDTRPWCLFRYAYWASFSRAPHGRKASRLNWNVVAAKAQDALSCSIGEAVQDVYRTEVRCCIPLSLQAVT